jgi:hypothetical protein
MPPTSAHLQTAGGSPITERVGPSGKFVFGASCADDLLALSFAVCRANRRQGGYSARYGPFEAEAEAEPVSCTNP